MSDFWDLEAISDPRYAKASWGMNGDEDAEETIGAILRILGVGMDHEDGVTVEVGSGPGRLLLRLADDYGADNFVGVDISPAMRAICERRIEEYGIDNVVIVPSLDACAHVDFIYAVELFQHLPDNEVRDYVDLAFDVLKPGGMMITQWVVHGERGPQSFPRDPDEILAMFSDRWRFHSYQQAVHRDWAWVTMSRPL